MDIWGYNIIEKPITIVTKKLMGNSFTVFLNGRALELATYDEIIDGVLGEDHVSIYSCCYGLGSDGICRLITKHESILNKHEKKHLCHQYIVDEKGNTRNECNNGKY